jgi:hypothetical protein
MPASTNMVIAFGQAMPRRTMSANTQQAISFDEITAFVDAIAAQKFDDGHLSLVPD